MLRIVSDVIFQNSNGQRRTMHELIKEKVVVLSMFYSNCKEKCQPLGRLMRRVYTLIGEEKMDNIQFLSISLDPEVDSSIELKKFQDEIGATKAQHWEFLTTRNEKILYQLRRRLGMYDPEPELDKIKANHAGHFLIFNTKTAFVKHTNAFDNPIDIARKIIQLQTGNFRSHHYSLDFHYDKLMDSQLFENIQSMSSMFTVPHLPKKIRDKYDTEALKQRGLQYNPIKRHCCGCHLKQKQV